MKNLITNNVILQDFQIKTVRNDELDFKANFTLKVVKAHKLHAFVVWFDTPFSAEGMYIR